MPTCDWFEEDQLWACMEHNSDYEGCSVGCQPCQHMSGIPPIGAPTDGRRWVRPNPAKPPNARESRNAEGEHLALISGRPMRVPLKWNGQLAQCWKNDGTEYFDSGRTICNCRFRSDFSEDPGRCHGLMADFPWWDLDTCWLFIGHTFPPYMQCTGLLTGSGPLEVSLDSGPFRQGMFARTSQCNSNVGIALWGHVESPRVPGCYQFPEGVQYYNNGSWRQWDWCRVTGFSGRFKVTDGPQHAYADRAMIDVKNAALAFVSTDIPKGFGSVLHFDQLHSKRSGSGPLANYNKDLDYFGRQFNVIETALVDFGTLPVVATFPGSHLKHSRCPLSVCEYVIAGAKLDMSLVLHQTNTPAADRDHGYPTIKVYPSVRVRLELTMGVRAQVSDCNFGGRILTLTDSDYLHRYPMVQPAGEDEIVYVDAQGRRLVPPRRIIWRGDLSPFSDPPWENVIAPATNYPEGLGEATNFFRHALSPLTVPAFPSHQGSSPGGSSKLIYDGSLTISFLD